MDNHLLLALFWFVRISNILVFITIAHFLCNSYFTSIKFIIE